MTDRDCVPAVWLGHFSSLAAGMRRRDRCAFVTFLLRFKDISKSGHSMLLGLVPPTVGFSFTIKHFQIYCLSCNTENVGVWCGSYRSHVIGRDFE